MPIEFRCPQCQQLLRVPGNSAGKKARCPKCQMVLPVPGGDAPLGGETPASPTATAAEANPFAFTGASGTGAAPPPQPEQFGHLGPTAQAPSNANPFVDQRSPASGASAHDVTNPYATPAAVTPYSPSAYGAAGQPWKQSNRPGLPWESEGQSLGTWWSTTKLVLGSPSKAYRNMWQFGGFTNPMLFTGAGMSVGAIGQVVWQIVFAVGIFFATNQGGDSAVVAVMQVVGGVIGAVMGVVIGATIGLLIAAAISHLFLMLVGATGQGFETTMRVVAFANGALGWLNWIPYAGPIVSFFWLQVLQVIGYTEAHEIPLGKAILAVALQFIVCAIIPAVVFGALFVWLLSDPEFRRVFGL